MRIRPYKKSDKEQLNALAIEAFKQYDDKYTDWSAMESAIGNMSSLDGSSEIIVAEKSGVVIGAVAFVPPGEESHGHFDKSWASIRMLVVSPAHRGKGIGQKLTVECIKRAKKMGASAIGLHTSPIMKVALSIYLKLGFLKTRNIEPIYGVEYSIYKLKL